MDQAKRDRKYGYFENIGKQRLVRQQLGGGDPASYVERYKERKLDQRHSRDLDDQIGYSRMDDLSQLLPGVDPEPFLQYASTNAALEDAVRRQNFGVEVAKERATGRNATNSDKREYAVTVGKQRRLEDLLSESDRQRKIFRRLPDPHPDPPLLRWG
eukprot:jgi/Mesvir1/19820/Mv13110-RA.1